MLTHYVGDACQPLHISYLHDGDPLRKFENTFQKGKKAGETEERPLGQGVHAAYEDAMISAYRKDILSAQNDAESSESELVESGFAAARRTFEMMRTTYNTLPPIEIVDAFVPSKASRRSAPSSSGKNSASAPSRSCKAARICLPSSGRAPGTSAMAKTPSHRREP